MSDLTRQERIALIFLTATFLLGLIFLSYKTRINQPEIEIIPGSEIHSQMPAYKVNINTASQEELTRLKGIGPSLAKAIVDFRKENGNFASAEGLTKVKGIGKAKFKAIKDDIKIDE